MHQNNTMAKEATKENGYKHIPMPADLRDELREQAAKQRERMHETITRYVREMIDEQWQPDWHYHTVYTFCKLEQHEMKQIEKLAQRCNLSLSGYVRAYHEHLKQNK